MPFKCYHQLEHSDCGLTCIRMVARHWGLRVPLRHLRQISDVSRLGMSLRDITGTLKKLHLDSAPVKITPADLERMPLPAILYWRQRHFVVLYKVDARRHRYHIADQIIFIKDGRIAETGTHDSLVSLKGHYWNLVKNQLQLSIA